MQVLNRVALAIRQEGREADINADIRMVAFRGHMVRMWFVLTHDEGIPVIVSTEHEVHRLGRSFKQAMQLDLERLAELSWHNQVFLVLVQIAIFAVLPELNGVPPVRALETREPARLAKFSHGMKALEGFGEAIRERLYGCGWYLFAAASFESRPEIILSRERLLFLILCFDRLKHLIIDRTRFLQALYEQGELFSIGIYPVLVCSHGNTLLEPLEIVKRAREYPSPAPKKEGVLHSRSSSKGHLHA